MKANATSANDDPVLHDALMAWYESSGRHALPWRLTRDPYAVLISEVMLQQTQVERVLPYYERWLERWPDFASLAAATPAEVIDRWAGLGYNRRALNLHRLAGIVTAEHGGALSLDTRALLALPGVGPYTAAAVQCFVRGDRVVVSDTNISRVIARLALGAESANALPAAELHHAAETILPAEGARDHNLALMDLGAMVCSARSPVCDSCPLADRCAWRRAGFPRAVAPRSKAVAFEETARYARGRIVHALRGSEALSAQQLAAALPRRHAARVAEYLFALARDGMVEQHADGQWALPGRIRAG